VPVFCSRFVLTKTVLQGEAAMRESLESLFVVRRYEDDTTWIAIQPKLEGLQTPAGEIGLNLYRGTSFEEAKQLARFLNSNIKSVNFRRVEKP
jgi:hypothetical protein